MSTLLVRRTAIISPCELFRYELRVEWDTRLPPLACGMLNPSKATAEVDDPTFIRVWRRAETLGCGSAILWNLGAGRATEPADWKAMADPIGPENDAHIRRILTECRVRNGIALVGWGAHGLFMGRDKIAVGIAAEVGIALKCLGVTKDGQPRHPLYIPGAAPLIEWAGSPAVLATCGSRP